MATNTLMERALDTDEGRGTVELIAVEFQYGKAFAVQVNEPYYSWTLPCKDGRDALDKFKHPYAYS